MHEIKSSVIHTTSGIPVKINKWLGIGYIIAALFFLFNPDITVIDIFPDIFGYILMCAGLSKLSLINSSFEEAADKFKKMIFVSGAKFIALVILFALFNDRERPYGLLLFAFSFFVLDLIYLLPAIKALFEGFIYLSGRYKSRVAYYKRQPRFMNEESDDFVLKGRKREKFEKRRMLAAKRVARRKYYIEKIYRLTMVFLIVKTAGYLLPEFTVLTKDEYTDGSFIMYLYDNIAAFRVLSFMIVLIFGIVWLFRTVRFFVKLCNEDAFIDNLREDFVSKAIPREGLFIKRAVKNALVLFGMGAIFCLDFHVSITLDNLTSTSIALNKITLNIIPDVISAAFFLAAALCLRAYVSSYKRLTVASSVYMSLSVVASVMKLSYLWIYGSYSAVDHVYEAYTIFFAVCGTTILENIGFVATVVCFASVMKEIINSYTGYIPSIPDHTTKGLIDGMHKELYVKVLIAAGVGVLAALISPIYDFMLIERHFFAQISWVIDFAAQALFAGFALHALFEVNDEVNSRYMLT